MADSNAILTPAPPLIATHAMPRSMGIPVGAPRSPVQYLQRGYRTAAPIGWVSWLSSGTPDPTGAQYSGGAGVLNALTIATVARVG